MKKIVSVLTLIAYCACAYAASAGAWTVSGRASATPDGVLRLERGASALLPPENNGGAFADFELSCEVRTSPNTTGFVAFHTDSAFSKGYKIALDNSAESKTWWRKTGSLLGVRNVVKRVGADGEWLRLCARVSGNLVEISVDGQKLVEYAEPENPYRLPQNKNARLGDGAIGVKCDSGGFVELRNFRVSKLKKSAARAQSEPETAEGVIAFHQSDFPVLDYHVHLKGDLDAEKAKAQSRKYGINYAIAVNCGKDFPIDRDSLALEFFEKNKSQPYIVAMQAEGREWTKLISKPVRAKFAYAFTDAMTFEDGSGTRVHLWIPSEVKVGDRQEYMDMIVEKICGVLGEPANIYANATYLPAELQPEYAKLWTPARRAKMLDALVRGGMALEISARYKIPDAEFVKAAKARGVKFTFGSNNGNSDFGKLEYCLKTARECGLTASDMLNPYECRPR